MIANIPPDPTWVEVSKLFSEPFWVADTPEERQAIGRGWIGAMTDFGIPLDDPNAVAANVVTIYDHLRSRAMPLTADRRQHWPDSALETLRVWANQGFRRRASDPFDRAERIPASSDPQLPIRVRRDIRSLSAADIDEYRARIDDVMRVADPKPDSPWQINAYIHTNWCLHYQEAFLMWHRAALLHLERQLGMPIPYWNVMAEDANRDGSPSAGLPGPFRDDTYVHPRTGEVRPNPLRYAAPKDGVSKACAMSPAPDREPKDICRWVQRDPVFYTEGDDRRYDRERKFRMVRIFQQQVVDALKWPTFSQPQGHPGYPWANITVFNPPQPDALYPNRTDFDGLLEQPHDNWHGWIGYDMADNAYTAFDPIFWSYHACIDRIFEMWLRAHPAAMFTSGFPIQPFAGPEANRILLPDPNRYLYTRIGDMARDSRAIGYDYGEPVERDFTGEIPQSSVPSPPNAVSQHGSPSIPPSVATSANAYVVFDGISCLHDSYIIDVFLNQNDPGETDVDPQNPHYVGRLTRIGMGIVDDKGRCIRHTVTRVLNATAAASRLGLGPGQGSISQLVTDVTRQAVIPRDEYVGRKGFEGYLVWGEGWPGGASASGRAASAPPPSQSCCH